jgi:hypothetical protein
VSASLTVPPDAIPILREEGEKEKQKKMKKQKIK